VLLLHSGYHISSDICIHKRKKLCYLYLRGSNSEVTSNSTVAHINGWTLPQTKSMSQPRHRAHTTQSLVCTQVRALAHCKGFGKCEITGNQALRSEEILAVYKYVKTLGFLSGDCVVCADCGAPAGCSGFGGWFPMHRVGGTPPDVLRDMRFELAYLGIV